MRSWKAPDLPTLPDRDAVPSLFDSRTQTILQLPDTGESRLYVCGITPYDATHMGHAATYVAFDLLHRAWLDAGHRVTYVQNVTDVDDPLLERAETTGRDWRELAQEQTDLFRADMEALRVLPPDHYIGAVESVEWIIPWVEQMLRDGLAYRAPGYTDDDQRQHPAGDVYFDVEASQDTEHEPARWFLGYVCGYDREQMEEIFPERGGDPQRPGKRNPLDALLWRAHREGEPSWSGGSLGPGRPGWHIECTVIAQKHLGMPYTVQGGGSDLRFPHHEMGAGHAYAMTGQQMAEHYAHTGMVGLDGEKMSKSRGNLVLVSTLRQQGVDPQAIRLAILAHHYRTDWFWTRDLLDQAQQRLKLWKQAVTPAAGREAPSADLSPNGSGEVADPLITHIRHALGEDLNTPQTLKEIDEWARHAVQHPVQPHRARAVRDLIDLRLGISL